MDGVVDLFRDGLGLDRQGSDLTAWNVSLRAIVVFLAGLAIMRTSNRRFLGKATAFDVLLGFLLGSVLSRAINGTAKFLPTLAGSAMIVLLHRALAALVYYAPGIGRLVKGQPIVLIDNGVVDRKTAAHKRLTEGDLEEAIRVHGLSDLNEVKRATLELNGTISVIPRVIRVEPIDLQADDEVKRVRIELELR
jgi:uncharacterized membrane protein YcaP (DUF421 family)